MAPPPTPVTTASPASLPADAPAASTHLRTAWHPVLVVLLEQLLPADIARVIAEYPLTREPRRIDAVVVRRDEHARDWCPRYLRSVLEGLRAHTIVHFKGATDELERVDAPQLLSYAYQYMALEDLAEPGDVALRVIAPTLTPRFAEQVRRLGGALAPTAMPGVHEGALSCFSLRVVEADVSWRVEHEHTLYAVTRGWIEHPERVRAFDDPEREVFYHLAQYVAKLSKTPTWKALMKDAALVESAADAMLDELFALKPGLKQRLIQKIAPEERLAGLDPAQRLAGLDPAHQIVALSDEVLRGLPAEYLATLPDDVQATIRARIGRPPAR